MAHIAGISRDQATLFPERLDDLIPADHPIRVIDAFVGRLDLLALAFTRVRAASTGRPGYDPGDLLRLYIWGYLNRIRSSRQLERECVRNVELMWLLGRLAPDFKTIADFRRLHEGVLKQVCRAWVEFCREMGLIQGEWVAIDGSKFGAVASGKAAITATQLARRRAWIDQQVQAYLTALEQADAAEGDGEGCDKAAIHAALARLADRAIVLCEASSAMSEHQSKQYVRGETQARLMRTSWGTQVAYNVQTVVDASHHLIVTYEVTNDCNDLQQLQPMAEAAKSLLAVEPLKVTADKGYSNGAQAHACEQQAIEVCVPPQRSKNTTGDGTLFGVEAFEYDAKRDRYRCPAGAELAPVGYHRADMLTTYRTKACKDCPIKSNCTTAKQRSVTRHDHEAAFARMAERMQQNPQARDLRRNIVEHPFGTLKESILVGGRFLLRHLSGARKEMALAVLAYNMRRAIHAVGAAAILAHLTTWS